MDQRGRPLQNPVAPTVFVREYFDKKTGVKAKWYYDFTKYPSGLYKTEYEYPREHVSFEDENNALPKTQRKYLNPANGKYVSYQRAKALLII